MNGWLMMMFGSAPAGDTRAAEQPRARQRAAGDGTALTQAEKMELATLLLLVIDA
jgi:hypothetical protein